ncbi:hypothetical protein ACSQ67_001724 [Phaseolus vulgaris]
MTGAENRNDSVSYANVLRSRNKFADALAIYERVLENDGANVEALIGKGICLQMQNKGRLAFESFLRLSSWILKMRVLSHIAAFCTRTMVA